MNVDVETLLRLLGIRARRRGAKWIATCPNPEHPDQKPSWSIVDRPGEKNHASHHCQSCKFGGGPWELAAAVWRVDTETAGKRLWSLLGGKGGGSVAVPRVVVSQGGLPGKKTFELPLGVVVPGPDGRWYGPALDYLLSRGVTRVQIDRWGLGYAVRGRLANRVVVPVRDGLGRLLNFSARAIAPGIDPRYDSGREAKGAKPRRSIWGEEHWSGGVATICEGVFSGLALERAGAPNPSALLGSQLTEEKARALDRFGAFLFFTDPDRAGDRVASWLSVIGRRKPVWRPELPWSPDDAPQQELEALVKQGLQKIDMG